MALTVYQNTDVCRIPLFEPARMVTARQYGEEGWVSIDTGLDGWTPAQEFEWVQRMYRVLFGDVYSAPYTVQKVHHEQYEVLLFTTMGKTGWVATDHPTKTVQELISEVGQ